MSKIKTDGLDQYGNV